MSKNHSDPTVPSAVREPYTTSFIHPSLPLCGQVVTQDHVYVNGCTPLIKSTYLYSTVEHILDFLSSYSQDEKYWAAFQSQFVMFDSSGLFFFFNPNMEPNDASASTTEEINHITATPQMDISYARGQWLLSNHIHIISTKHICPQWQLSEYREFLVNPPHRQQWANHKRISHTADSEHIFESILWDVNHIINIITG